jgi:hypothetical protein
LQLLDSGTIGDDALRAVPKDSTMFVAGKIDFAKLLSMARTIGGKIDPNVPNGINAGLVGGNMVLGINIEEDLLKTLGDDWLAYTSPSIGGVGPLGFVIVNHARDAAKLEKALAALEQFANSKINADSQPDKPHGNFVMAKLDGVSVHYLNTPLITPAWAVKNGNLYVALYPQTAAAAANAPTDSSILNNADFLAVRKRLGGEKASVISFFDLPKSAPVGYPYVLAASHVVDFADMFGIPTPPAVLPSIGKIMPLLTPAGGFTWTDDSGVHIRGVTPFPGATLLGGPEAILIEGNGLIGPGLALPAWEKERAQKAALQEKGATREK